jgi:DNA invertase Pin-like site-specific DNA recombinase
VEKDHEMNTRAATYCRTAVTSQFGGNFDLSFQEACTQDHCGKHDYIVVSAITEIGPGLRTEQRPGLAQLRDLMHEHEIDVIVVARFDRVARGLTDLTAFIREAEECGVRIESISEPSVLLSDFSAGVPRYVERIEHSKIRKLRVSKR